MSIPFPALWPPQDRFKGHILQVTFSYTAHRSSRLDFSYQLLQPKALHDSLTNSISLPPLPSLYYTVGFKMRCIFLNTPATTDILCGIKWAYLSYELSLSHACAILNFDVSLFLQTDKWDGKFSCQKHICWKLLHCYPPQWCQNWTEQHEEMLYQKAGGLGCHRMVTFCVERHYDNEHSFSITSTSWAPFPLMCFSEGNSLWQSYLLHCIAGLFLEVTFKKSATENICENLYQSSFPQCIIGCYGK